MNKIKYSILLLIITFLIFIFQKGFKETFQNSPSPTDNSPTESGINEYESDENKVFEENLLKYRNIQEIVHDLYKIKIGHDITLSTNKEKIGSCSLGEYDIEGECERCSKCPDGTHQVSGCIGDTDTKCAVGKAPYKLYIDSHGCNKISQIHNSLQSHDHSRMTPFNHKHCPNN
jgi:hypothetical protein